MDHRYGEVELTLLDQDGAPLADTDVTVEQRRHAFAFGNIAFDLVRMVGGPDPAATAGVEGFGSDATLDLDAYADEAHAELRGDRCAMRSPASGVRMQTVVDMSRPQRRSQP